MINQVSLGDLIYSPNITEPLRLYIFELDGFHHGGIPFRRSIKYKGEEVSADTAQKACIAAISRGLEVRITNTSGFLVLHAKDGRVLYPANPDAFWRKVLAA